MKKINLFDVVIIGGGASGSYCAINLDNKKLNVAVIDANDFPAKKLLVTGNGKCNITNEVLNSVFYNQNIDKFIKKCNYLSIKEDLKKFGIYIYSDEQKRCYPITNDAKSVVSSIKNQFLTQKIAFYQENFFENLEFNKKENMYYIETNSVLFKSKYIVIASGNCDIKNMLNKFNITIKSFVPSLVALKTIEFTKKLDGIRLSNVIAKAKCDGKTMEQFGEVLFKEQGLSGISIFNLSSLFARNNNFNGKIIIDILPSLSNNQIVSMIQNNCGIYNLSEDVLNGIVNKQIANDLFSRLKIKCIETKRLGQNEILRIANLIKNYEFNICTYYDNQQVYSGGVELKSLDDDLQSKLYKNLYFCGEICDVDGICGGYNLSWAYMSAKIVADNINSKN